MLRAPTCSARCAARPASSSRWVAPLLVQRPALIRAAGRPRATPEQEPTPKPAAADAELPPWVRREKERELQQKEGSSGLPWPLYLLFSIFTAIAAVGSVFEFLDGNALFGVLPPDNPLWAPILLVFAVTGLPTSGFLFIQGVNKFNEDAERQDKLDGYL